MSLCAVVGENNLNAIQSVEPDSDSLRQISNLNKYRIIISRLLIGTTSPIRTLSCLHWEVIL